MPRIVIDASILLVAVLILFSFSCSGGSPAPMSIYDGDYAQFGEKIITASGGKPVGNVHQLHSGLAQCTDCHAAHGMGMGWATPTREYCYTCHPDKTNHKTNKDCLACHNTSGGPGGGGGGGAPAAYGTGEGGPNS